MLELPWMLDSEDKIEENRQLIKDGKLKAIWRKPQPIEEIKIDQIDFSGAKMPLKRM